jgi:hypothetical protein
MIRIVPQDSNKWNIGAFPEVIFLFEDKRRTHALKAKAECGLAYSQAVIEML